MIFKTLQIFVWPSTAVLFVAGLACATPVDRVGGERMPDAGSPPAQGDSQVIDHIAPARDSSGPPPSRFEWTSAKGADRYSIGVWSEVDVLMWRQDNLSATSVERPVELRLAPGTYFWSVAAWREGRPIAESGRAAFVVLP